jgi:hypothetical protein
LRCTNSISTFFRLRQASTYSGVEACVRAASRASSCRSPHTQYQNGLDGHLDTGASYFLTQQLNVGLVGYYSQQLTGDRGLGATLGPFKSRVAGIGRQLNYFFPVGDKIQGVVNVKAYREFAAENRPEGWNVWLTVAFSPAPPKKAEPQ